MKIAVPSELGLVATHFGHCPEFAIFTVGIGDVIVEKAVLPSPGHRQRGFLPGYLAQMGVTHVLAGGMGHWARRLFADRWVITVVGASGPVDQVVKDFLANRLVVAENRCLYNGACEKFSSSSCENKVVLLEERRRQVRPARQPQKIFAK